MPKTSCSPPMPWLTHVHTSRAHVVCVQSLYRQHLLHDVHVQMHNCTCACASGSSAQNAQKTQEAQSCTHYSPSVQVSPVYEVIVQSHLPIGRRHRPLFAHACSASEQTGGKKTPPGKGPLVVVTLVGDPCGTLWGPLVFIQSLNVALSLTLGHIRQISF